MNIEDMMPAPDTAIQEPEPISELLDYAKAKLMIEQVIGSWTTRNSDSETRRQERYVELDVDAMRRDGDIDEDETFIPDRVIDGNIKSDNADVMTFLNSGERLAIFDCLSDPSIDTRELERQFTKGLTYTGWYKEFNRVSDGAALHGQDYVEVMFDITKPLHISFEHVGYDKLMFNDKVDDIQDSELLIRKYSMSVFKVEEFAKQIEFNQTIVDELIETHKQSKRNDVLEVYKVYFKADGIVYIAWHYRKGTVQDWLKAPEPLRLGLYEQQPQTDPVTKQTSMAWVEKDITKYPIFTFLYCDDEQQVLVDHKGRSFLDGPTQEANTAILTGFVNGVSKSAAIFASPETGDMDSPEMKILDLELESNRVFSHKINFWSKPPPDPTTINSLQVLDARNDLRRGKPSFAVSNRKDSRKTAEELQQASGQQQKITSTGLAGFSEFLRFVLEFTWPIIQSQALQDKIKFLLIATQPDPLQPDHITYVNDYNTISQDYDIRPAGDTDVIEAQQKQQQMMQDWPVVQTTGLKIPFLIDYIKLRYPKKADDYVKALQQGYNQQAKQLVQAQATALQGALNPQELATLSPQDKQGLQTLQQETQSFLQTA